jgi:hypothetical protein
MPRASDMRHLLRNRSILRSIAALVFPLVLTAGVSCNAPAIGSPFVPIPPPIFGPPTPEIDSAGVTHTYWKVTSPPSPALSDLWVYLTNMNMGSGVIVRAALDGSYTTRIEGQQGDPILFNFGSLDGTAMCRPLREGVADTPCQ